LRRVEVIIGEFGRNIDGMIHSKIRGKIHSKQGQVAVVVAIPQSSEI